MNNGKTGAYYHNGAVQQDAVVVQMNSAPAGYHWNWCWFVTSVIGNFCCQPLGFIALIMSLLAYTDHKSKDYNRAHSKKNTALGLAIAAIVFGVVFIIITIAIVINSARTVTYTSYNYGK
jgi:hypothetical protein